MFLLVINIRTLGINLRNELLYLFIFITYMRGYMRGFAPSSIPHFTLKFEFYPKSLRMTPESQRPLNKQLKLQKIP